MKIGINLLPLRPGKNGGMEVYLRNLLEHLFLIDNFNQYYLITAPYNENSLKYTAKNCHNIPVHGSYRILSSVCSKLKIFGSADQRSEDPLVEIIRKYDFDLWFCPFLSLDPRPLSIPGIVTIPDLQHEYFPEYFSKEELALRKGYILPSCEQASKIVTISEFSKESFIEKLGIDPEKIVVIYLAAGDNFGKSSENAGLVSKKYNLPENFLLYPANAWEHKNHLMLLEAFKEYRKRYSDSLNLIFTGSGFGVNRSIQNFISEHRLTDCVHVLDYVDKEDMPGLYACAKALVFPSLFEGFGIPVIEAMASECPVIASNTTSIPEIAGDAAYLFDPKDPQDICVAMHKVISDSSLRDELILKGKERAKLYSYEKVAEMHLDLFRSVCSHDSRSDKCCKNDSHRFYGLYSDGWFSKVKFIYCGAKNYRHLWINLRGELPVNYPMKIKVILNGKKTYNIGIPEIGKYTFGFEIPDICEKSGECSVEIISKKSYSPKKLGIGEDERKLSLVLESLKMSENNENPTDFVNMEVI
ncbi:glycosyltransferase involved in cell wall biosynthesis [Methanomicrobium sp. W14]|uniref:glycosyltransferase family 4 protein n=1 Tax=Methanomicrobium sp. W14 TaxID=2817839 RepID=UPI001AE653A3|nr:glycosyltransferase family 1 protein [Methanomicrobium sp. W14]MBP2134453.1 glycosyltransferase involved in cell wall biosynthesis [Methanomicrobium sp. W14]